jgi:outer membrane protein assembly factor BamE (lipoprotein component of BamABCDE complex)
MKKLMVVATLCLSLLFFSCGYKSIKHGTEITEGEAARIVDGQSTKEDVIMMFGDPSKTMNDESVYFYNWTRGGKGSFMGFGSGSAYTHSLVIVFNDDGVVKTHKITRGTTEAKTGIGD